MAVDRPTLEETRIPIPANEARQLAVARRQLWPGSAQPAPNIEGQSKEFVFTQGIWVPGEDPLMIGEKNFTILQNLRYRQQSLETVNGYSKITAAAHGTYTRLRSGIQLNKPIDGGTQSFVLAQAQTADLLASAVLYHTATIPATGAWQATPLWTDAVPWALGRFSLAPDGNIAYANELESLIWGSPEHRCGACLVVNAAGTFRRDYSEAVQDNLSSLESVASIHVDGATAPVIVIGSTRRLTGAKFYIVTPNTNAVTLTGVEYWGASGWAAAGAVVDGTLLAGETMGQTGSITWTTGNLDIPKLEDEYVLYFYRLTISGATSSGTTVRYVTVNAPFQTIKDVWNGVYRTALKFIVSRAGSNDLTLFVAEDDDTEAEIGAVDFTGAGDHVLAGFGNRTQTLRLKIKTVNAVAATVTVSYWNGSGWVTAGNIVDTTLVGGVSLARTGTISWTPPAIGAEFPQTLFGQTAFYYRLTWSATLTAGTGVDLLQGIPASRTMHGFRFPFRFQGRLFLMGDVLGNQRNKAEYSVTNAPDFWNGDDSSADGKELFFGENSGQGLMAAVEVYNRFAGSLAYLAVVCTESDTYVLTGNAPENFAIFPVSHNIGCPAPLTMCSAEVSYSVAEDAQRNVALWLSYTGPYLFDGSVLVPIPGLEPYFEVHNALYINPLALSAARGWYDPEWQEWNLTFAIGTSIVPNVHVCYDLRRQRWYEKVPSVYLSGAIPVVDVVGRRYTYGLTEAGLLLHLEDGHTWDGTPITWVLGTSDLLPTASLWDETELRYLVLAAEAHASASITPTYYAGGATSGTALTALSLVSSRRYVSETRPLNLTAVSHRLHFTGSTAAGHVSLFAWGGLYKLVRKRYG